MRVRGFFCWGGALKVVLLLAICSGFWFVAGLLPGKRALWIVLSVWLLGSSIILYVPQMAVRGGRYTRENIVQAYFFGGLLMIFFGALSAGYAMQIGSVQTLSSNTIDVLQIAMLACTATVGGALCADAVLGLELDDEARQINPSAACMSAAVLAVAAICVSTFLAGRDARTLDAIMVVGVFVVVVCLLFPWLAVCVAAGTFKWARAQRKPLCLLVLGIAGIASAILGVLIVPDAMRAAKWAPGSIDFLEQLFIATGAAIGGALIARALETNVHRFDFERWAGVVVAGAFDHKKAEVNDGIIIVRPVQLGGPSENPITITIETRLLLRLMNLSEVSRKEIAGLASAYLKNAYAKESRKVGKSSHINYKLKLALLKDL